MLWPWRSLPSVYGSARRRAEQQNDSYQVIYFNLRGVQSCVALLDFGSAAQMLEQILSSHPGEELLHNSGTAIAAASTLTVPYAKESDVHYLRIEALLSLSRYLGTRTIWTDCDCVSTRPRGELSRPDLIS